MHVNDMVKEAYQNAKEHGWHDEPRTFGDIIALIHAEASEALEEHRNGHVYDEIYFVGNSMKPEGIIVELADIVIRIADFCGSQNLDLADAIAMKMEYNKTRPYRHGGKVI